MSNFFWKIIHKNVVEKLFSDPFLKNRNLSYIWVNSLKFYIIFILCQIEDHRNILKLSYRPFTFTSYKAFLENKKRSGTSLPV